MNDKEWAIVTGVFNSSCLPLKQRIFITDGLGAQNRPFTIPTSLISSLPAVLASALTGTLLAGPAGTALASALASVGALLGSVVNFGYIMSVGASSYTDMSRDFPNPTGRQTVNEFRKLLVHETTHVWQGKNSLFALSYVFGSAISQCAASLGGGTTGGAYAYTAGTPWGNLNPEQQAHLVEDWYDNGESGSDPLYPYIRDKVRQGKTS
jgi:hypothetical protein